MKSRVTRRIGWCWVGSTAIGFTVWAALERPGQGGRQMRALKNGATLVLICFLSASNLLGGKPYRKPVKDLWRESQVVIKGQVLSLHPSTYRNHSGEPRAMAKVRALQSFRGHENLNGSHPLFVVTDYSPHTEIYSEEGMVPRSTEWKYWLEPGSQTYLLFLNQVEGSYVYIPVQDGAGIIDLDSKRIGDGPQYLEQVMEIQKPIDVKEK